MAHHNDDNIRNDIENGFVYLLSDIGTVTIKGNHINRLFVMPKNQGKGYGKLLMDFAENVIFKQYCEIITDASLPAKGMYKKRGYIEINYSTIETENNFLDYHKKKFLTWRVPEKISGMKTQRSENYTLKATDLYH